VGPGTGLNTAEKRKFSCLCWESNFGRPARRYPDFHRGEAEAQGQLAVTSVVQIFLFVLSCSQLSTD
jgi:hypothetical protein